MPSEVLAPRALRSVARATKPHHSEDAARPRVQREPERTRKRAMLATTGGRGGAPPSFVVCRTDPRSGLDWGVSGTDAEASGESGSSVSGDAAQARAGRRLSSSAS